MPVTLNNNNSGSNDVNKYDRSLQRPRHHVMLLTAVACLSLLMSGCSTSLQKGVRSRPVNRVTLDAGDDLDIRFYYSPELNDRQIVRPDGMITLQLAGSLMVRDLTPEELRQLLHTKFSRLIEKPEVVVIVRGLTSRAVYVTGAVNRPGRIEMPGEMTVLEAITRASGLKIATARPSNVTVIRQKDGKHNGYVVDLGDALTSAEHDAFFLHPDDIVHVPESLVVKTARWIDQHINSMIPQFGVSVTEQISDDTVVRFDTTDYRSSY